MKCPVCNSSAVTPKEGYKRGKFQLYSCAHCGLGFIQPLPWAAELKQYYSSAYELTRDASHYIERMPIHRDTEMVHRIIREGSPNARDVLEVGCAFGSLLAGLQSLGYQVRGFELSEPLANLAKVRGLDVEVGEIPDDLGPKYDGVIERHVLEHTLDPGEEVTRIWRALKPGGVAIFVVPNFSSLASRICKAGWEWFCPPIHLYYFSHRSISNLLSWHGLEMENHFSRRGDAKALIVGIGLGLYVRARGVSTTTQGKESPPRRAVSALVSGANYASHFGRPFRALIDKSGLGEELWCIARK